jgi:hypothetical protein
MTPQSPGAPAGRGPISRSERRYRNKRMAETLVVQLRPAEDSLGEAHRYRLDGRTVRGALKRFRADERINEILAESIPLGTPPHEFPTVRQVADHFRITEKSAASRLNRLVFWRAGKDGYDELRAARRRGPRPQWNPEA